MQRALIAIPLALCTGFGAGLLPAAQDPDDKQSQDPPEEVATEGEESVQPFRRAQTALLSREKGTTVSAVPWTVIIGIGANDAGGSAGGESR